MSKVPFPLFYSNNSDMGIDWLRDVPPTPDQLSTAAFQNSPSSSPRENDCPWFTPLGHKRVPPVWSMVGVNPNPHIASFDFWCFRFFFLDRHIQFELIFALAIL